MNVATSRRSRSGSGQRMLNASAVPDFLASSQEWRRLLAEAWGAFLLVVVAATKCAYRRTMS